MKFKKLILISVLSLLLSRKKIRTCCDELNKLVPFCNSGSDKVTTLQWTTAFLRYISKTYGDTFKQVSLCSLISELLMESIWLDRPAAELFET